MKNPKLNREEKKILKAFEAGKLKSVRGTRKRTEDYRKHAEYTLRKSRSINIRLSEKDFHRIKAAAAEKGLPYQTLISSLIHQYSEERPEK